MYIDDLSHACVLGIETKNKGVFNISSGAGNSIMDIIEIIESILKIKIKTKQLPVRNYDVKSVVLSNTKSYVKHKLQSKTYLIQGIEQFAQHLGLLT